MSGRFLVLVLGLPSTSAALEPLQRCSTTAGLTTFTVPLLPLPLPSAVLALRISFIYVPLVMHTSRKPNCDGYITVMSLSESHTIELNSASGSYNIICMVVARMSYWMHVYISTGIYTKFKGCVNTLPSVKIRRVCNVMFIP